MRGALEYKARQRQKKQQKTRKCAHDLTILLITAANQEVMAKYITISLDSSTFL